MCHKPYLILGFVCVALAANLCGQRDSYADGRKEIADDCVKRSGVASQLEVLAQAVLSTVPDDALGTAKARSDAAAVLKREVSAAGLLSKVTAALVDVPDKDSLQKVHQFYETKTGIKVARLHACALDASTIKAVREGRKSLTSADPSRLRSLQRIATAQNIEVSSTELLVSAIRGMVDGTIGNGHCTVARAEDMQARLGAIDRQIRSDVAKAEDMAVLACAFTYRTLDAKELEALAGFLESPAASQFRSAVQEALRGCVRDICRVLGSVLTRQPGEASAGRSRRPQG